MKTKILFLYVAVAGLSGCAVYPLPVHPAHGRVGPAYVVEQPAVSIYGGSVHQHGGPSSAPVYPREYSRPHPGHGARDRDRDGIPDRWDRDRDGDGVRNRDDRQPSDPRRR